MKILYDVIITYDFLLFFLNQLSFCGKFSAPFRLIMKFVLQPSLEHIALVKVVISLWNQNDVRSLIAKHNFSELFSSEIWMTIEGKVIEKVPKLLVPQILGEKVIELVNPIGLQIKGWMDFHARYYSLLLNLPAELCWTPQGTVNRKRTAEVLVRDESLDISTRYVLACIYCMEDDIIQFWNSMPENLKESVSRRFPEINFWTHSERRKASDINYGWEFVYSAWQGNKVAAEFFLQKLTPQEREESFLEATKYVSQADFLCFLLTKMNEEQQMKMFKNNLYRVLQCFLQWPWQSFFIGVANCIWDFLSKDNYDKLLGDIIGKVKDGYKDYNYQKLFREFWQKSPSALKDSVIEEIDNSSLLQHLFEMKDKEIIRLILKDVTLTAKEKLIYSYRMNIFCQRYIRKNKWDFLEFFIRECFPSKTGMLKFKDEFEKRMYFKECSATEKPIWDQLFSFSDDSICKYGKRNIEEGQSSSSKRFQNL